VTPDPLSGHVVVLAGPGRGADADTRRLAIAAGTQLLARGALVAAVTTDAGVIDELERIAAAHGLDPPVAWRADPGDPTAWERLYPHIEQRLGPVDAVVVDPTALDLVETVFRADMQRRGHGAIVALSPTADPLEAIGRQLHRRQ
jgi:hypothetical protein